jgi:amino acid adenylation domain-containing protein
MVAEQAARTPDAAAVALGDRSLTYAQLEARAGRLAARLRAQGVAPGMRVGICLERSPEWVVAVLAVMKSGAAYVPLDPAHPEARLAQLLRDAGARLLVTETSLRGRFPAEDVEVVLLDGGAEDADTLSHSRTFALSHSQLAYVVYTSGSTGTPKGVMVEHRGLAATLLAAREAFGFAPGAAFGVLASPAFDIWAFEALLPLTLGGTARIVPREHVRDVARLAGEVERMDVLHAVPALMAELVRAAREGRADFSRVRRVFVGGEAVPPELLEEMRDAFPAARLHVLYGPTEGTIICASHAVPGEGGAARRMLGAPLPGAALHVCDAAGGALPAAFPGELCIGGSGVARGYLDRPELTAERFVPDPFSGVPGARLYRSGDRARWLESGELEFLGRTDAQLKIRGFRIEPDEVEAALAAHPGVRQAVVVAREHPAGGLRLAAHAVPRPGAAPLSGAELRDWLRDRLPDYMVPAAVLVAESLPLTPTGKVDRRALPAPDLHAEEGEAPAGLPATPTEEVVAAVWAEVLRVPRVGPGDDFFELGGHSLLATQVVARLRGAFGAEIPVRAVFESPTPAGLAAAVDAVLRTGRGVTLPPLVRADRSGPLPLSFAQQRLWVIDRMDPGSPAYNVSITLRLRGGLDAGALRAALDALVERHESLRTVFPAGEGGPVQAVLPAAGAPLAVDPLHGVPGDRREAEALRRAAEEARRPFDLAAGPLFRPVLLRVADDDHLLVLAQHHVVSDGWSMGVLFRELGALYAAAVQGAPSPLPELPVQYADYAVWQRGWLVGETLERQVAYWRDALAGAPPLLELPTDRPRSGARSAAGAPHRFPLPAAAVDGLRAAARAEGTTLFMTLLAAWQLLLSRYARQDDVVVGTAIAGRTHQSVEGLVGMFVNTLAIRTDLSGDRSFRGLLGRVRERTLGAYAHQDLPFEKLVDELHPVRDVTHTPVFQVTFGLQNAPGGGPELPGLEISPVAPEGRTAKFDLSLAVVEVPDGLYGVLEYATDLFDAATARRMAGHFGTLLAGLAADPDARLSDAVLLDAAERRRVLEEWSGGEAPRPAAWVPVHERVLARAAEAPDALALVCGGKRVTYGELDARSAELAGRLRARGVGPETRVALLLERSPEGVVAMLAVLRAGGAYLPLDPATPPERVARILEDAEVALVLDGRGVSEGPGGPGAGGGGGGVSPDAAAYVIYTSGSTGTPKGVVVTHGALAGLVDWHMGAFGVTAADHATQLTGLGFDASVEETWAHLAAGGTLHLVTDEEARTSPAALQRFLLEHRIAVALLPAPLAEGMLALEWPDPVPLRTMVSGGDALRVRPPAGLPFQLVNAYGPTENTVVAATGVVRPGGGDARAPAIGRPVTGVRAYVLDPALGPVPAGVPGELCLGGRSVARGYLGRPEATAAAFVPDPFAGEAGARMYRTGDLVRWLEDGELEFLGRIDRQIKVRGFRIEPGEIEAVLARHPGVRGVAVVVRDGASGQPGDRRIVAYLEADGVSPREARELARASLPEYMVPSAFVVLDALPLTPSGKLDRRALPAPEPSGAGEEDGEEPRTELERTIAAVWEEVLGVPAVRTGASFFDLGGNSLLVVRAAERLEAELGRRVPVLDLFRHGTVAALARHLSGDGDPQPAPPADESRPSRLAAGKGRLNQLRRRKDAGG